MKDSDDQTPPGPFSEGRSPDELLGALESIKDLLDEQGNSTSPPETAPEPGEAESGVPPLDDMIDGAYELKETRFTSVTPALGGGDRPASRPLGEDLFDALLGDEWKTSAADVFTEARGAIEAHRNDWTPEHTDELNEALRVRIDETLNRWLRDTVRARLDALRAELLIAAEAAIREKVTALVDQEFGSRTPDSDGDVDG